MCTVSVTVVDIMIGDMIEESSYNDVSVEELYLAIEKDVKEIYGHDKL